MPREWFPGQQQTGGGASERRALLPGEEAARRGGGGLSRAGGGGARSEGRMQGPGAPLLLSAGELGVAHQGAAAWYRQEGGRTSSPAPWPWACHSEFPPADPLPWPGPASACPEGVRAGGKRRARSLASARRLGHAFESQAQGTHAQNAADLCPLGSLHTPAPDYGQSPDGEARCRPPIVAGGGCKKKKTWVGGNKRSESVGSG